MPKKEKIGARRGIWRRKKRRRKKRRRSRIWRRMWRLELVWLSVLLIYTTAVFLEAIL